MMKLSFAYHVNQFDNGQERLCPPKRFESRHLSYPTFDTPVILLNPVVQILVLPDGDDFFTGFVGVECSQRCRVGTIFINGHYRRFAVVPNGLTKETQRCCSIPPGGQQEVDGLACSIHRAVQVFLLAFDFDVGFIHAPAPTRGTFMPPERLIQ